MTNMALFEKVIAPNPKTGCATIGIAVDRF